jgi:hypothetical protein
MARRIPLIRIGLLLIVGAAFASVINFYVGMGTHLADFASEDLSTEPRDLWVHFRDNFLFAGSAAGLAFWAGIAICAMGIVRNFMGGRRKR